MARRHLATGLLGIRCLRLLAGFGLVMTHALVLGQGPVTVRPDQTMQAESQSAGQSVQSLEKKLDKLIAQIQSGISRPQALRLKSLQLQWKVFTKADCAWEMKFAQGGSIAPLIYATCMERQLTTRIDRLKPILCEGEGMTGSCKASEAY